MSGIPVKALGKEANDLLSSLLNPEKIFLADTQLPCDWRGLAELCDIGGQFIPNFRGDNPTKKILKTWSEKNETGSTIDKLLSFLAELDRYDVLDDITPIVEKDVEYFNSNPRVVDPVDSDDEDILTYDDDKRKMERKPLLTYDAFVLFHYKDIAFVTDIIEKLEGKYKMKLCVTDRDLAGGRLEHSSVIKLITMRCNKIIAVVSTAFLESSSTNFFYNLAQLDGLEKCYSKIIPCMREPCVVPIEYRMYHALIFSRIELFGNFWDQLSVTVRNMPALPNSTVMNEGNHNTTPETSAEPTEPVNHIEFTTPMVLEESRQEDSTVLPKDMRVLPMNKNIPFMSISDEPVLTNTSDDTVILEEMKKKRSFKNFFNKIINPKSKKEKVLKKKSRKKKMVVAN